MSRTISFFANKLRATSRPLANLDSDGVTDRIQAGLALGDRNLLAARTLTLPHGGFAAQARYG
jgi:hypothetical protein